MSPLKPGQQLSWDLHGLPSIHSVHPDHAHSDLGNSRRLLDRHVDLIHVMEVGWHVWDTTRWRLDSDGEVKRRMSKVCDELGADAFELSDGDQRKAAIQHALSSASERRINAALALAETNERAVLTADQLDAKPDLLPVANGVVDLKTGRLKPPNPEDYLTLGSGVEFDPDAKAARWDRFLLEVFGGDVELIAGVQRLVGYILTGSTREHVLPVLHGDGANGKSVFVGVLEHLLGDLAKTASFGTFLVGGNAEYDLARLRGARLVVASESSRGGRLADTVVKQVTGGDTITARHPYGRPFSFRPNFTAILVTNHRPHADATDEAIWRRLRLIPFDVSFRDREDRGLAAELQGELPGILAWAVQGAVEWHQRGLEWPDAITQATASYRTEEDPVASFLSEECELGPGHRTLISQVRARFERWAKENEESLLSPKGLTQELRRHGVEPTARTMHGRLYVGLKLNDLS